MTPEDYSPMMKQYLRIKEQVGDAVLFFRVGDFYETFMEDAILASRVLEITLTKKFVGKGETVPLAGVPYHALEAYIYRLTREGYRAAICEQVGDPKKSKTVVEREVSRTVTPGTVMEAEVLGSDRNNYLCAVWDGEMHGIGFAFIDLSTGEFSATGLTGKDAMEDLGGELSRVAPAECLLPERTAIPGAEPPQDSVETLYHRESEGFVYRVGEKTFDVSAFEGGPVEVVEEGEKESPLAPRTRRLALRAAGAVWRYLEETQRRSLSHVLQLRLYRPAETMTLDAATERNLELFRNARDGGVKGSLFHVLRKTVTAPGARLLRKWIGRPLLKPEAIRARHDAVESLCRSPVERDELLGLLEEGHDLERLTARTCFGNATPRDVLALGQTLAVIPRLNVVLTKERLSRLSEFIGPLPELPELRDHVLGALQENPPVSARDGGIFREGYHAELDELRDLSRSGKDWIARLQAEEREKTGIGSLKVGYTKVFGYYLEVTRANLANVPEDWIRKQTLVNAERFITPELKEYESKVLGAEERIQEIEYALFTELRKTISLEVSALQDLAGKIATLDVLLAFAQVAVQNDYKRPEVFRDGGIEIHMGRHPVLESMDLGRHFVPNDTLLDMNERQVLIITGPNMAGKSTYIRQVALIVLLAQIGSYVPAEAARIGVVDRIFTRVGASDNLARGESTFMVEMKESAHILRHATPNSLIILDEIGRGTSTFDGISLAWSIAEYLHGLGKQGVKTLFATHYHELADLEERLERVKNMRVLVSENQGKIAFLYQIAPGASDHSYGIHVAELAGLPDSIVRRARKVLSRLEKDHALRPGSSPGPAQPVQLTLFSMNEDHIRDRLKSLNVDSLTPLDALRILSELIEETREE